MNRGYIKLWRRALDGGWLNNPNLWTFWCYCLLKASHKRCKVLIGFKEIVLEPGQFVFGRKQATKNIGLSEQTVRTCLQVLKSTNNITTESTNRFTIITINNWSAYQEDEQPVNQQKNHQVNQQLTNNQPATNHIQECKECKEEIQIPLPSVSASANGHIPYDEIRKLYNKMLPELTECRFLSAERKKQIKSCWHQEPGRTDNLEFWKEFFEVIQNSDFLMGRSEKPWRGCNLEWVTKKSKFINIREGRYNH